VKARSISANRAQQERDAAHTLIDGVDRQRGCEGSNAISAFGEVVDEVEELAEITAGPVEGVDDRVAVPGIAEQGGEAVGMDGCVSLLVGAESVSSCRSGRRRRPAGPVLKIFLDQVLGMVRPVWARNDHSRAGLRRMRARPRRAARHRSVRSVAA
jgi:hypothetical protein